MEQHPIPQQISSYEFRLVGSMTLKQFLKLATGVVLAFIIQSRKWPFLVKWPLALISAGAGAALAFVPFNERPLEVWILSFFKSLFNPTIFLWRKQPGKLDILDTVYKKEEEEEELIVSKEPKLKEFIASLPKEEKIKPLVKEEKKIEESVPEEVVKEQELSPYKEQVIFEKKMAPKPTAEAEFGEIPMPEPPTKPNIIVGMVVDENGKIIENAIIEIQDSAGNPVRALRTNSLGQFRTSAPVANGEYVILIEKEGFNFDILKLKAEGKVIEPMKIKAMKKGNSE